MPLSLPVLSDLPDEVVGIAATLERAGFETWCVGGALRDRLLGSPAMDVDLATAARPEEVRRLFPRTVAVGARFGTVGVLDNQRVLHEVTTFRKDVETDGRHAVVEFGATLEEDLARRDFTINALAYHPIKREWRDPHAGAADLEGRVIRAVGNPATRFAEDYLRILRALRFAARLRFTIEPETWRAAVAAAPGLAGLSAERVRDEWFKGLGSAQSIAALVTLWHQAGAAREWVPELAAEYPFADDPPADRDPVLLTTGLCDMPDRVLERLRASNEEIARARALRTGPPAPSDSDPRSVRRWMAEVEDGADDLMRLARLRAGAEPEWGAVVA
ncbi:MAG TPA: CCA tRNA nucleotidyltransferase, partial [Gemmatimonadales bacterium]|nr:CCA tRNA nucleotidyltransferase [Gemmatimonadales bacterium]